MQRVLQFLFLALSIAILFGVSTREAKADDPNATTIRTRLEEFFELTDTLSQFEELDEEIPFTDFSPSSTEGLQLADLLADADALAANSLEDKVASLSVASLASLQSGIDGADATYGDVDVTFDSVTVALNGGNPDLIDVGFTLTLTRNGVTLPVSYTDGGSVNLHGGSISVDLSASAVLSFQLDTSATDPDLAFYTVGAPQFDFSAAATGSITGFTANFGLTEVSVSGTATLNIDINLDFVDPDADGKITVDEWTSTSIPDLVDAGFGNGAGDDVNIALSLDTTLLTGSPDATVTLVDDDLSNGLNSPSVTLGLLDKFDNLSPTQLLGGIAQLVGALGSAQGNAAGKLPFIQGTLDAIGEGAQKVFEIAEPLIKFLDGQGAAAITCGTMDNGANLPSGPFANLPPGSTLYCRAVTAENPTAGSITWTITGGTAGANTSAPGSNGTVAEIPTKSATFANVGGSPDVRVVFTDSKGSHTVDPINSVQEMVTLLQDAGLDLPPLNYDSSTQALTFDLTKSSTDPAAKTGQIDFGDQLREAANLAGLSADIDAGADATVDVSGVNLDLTFGAILVDDPADITPNTGDPDIGDRFFVKVDNTASAHEFKVDSASITADVFLKGRVGFLEVTAEGDDGANPSGDAFDVSKLVGADPVLSADIVASGVPVGGGSPFTIPDAVLISELLTALGPSPIACGTANADPPTGDATGAGSGATVYCQATTAKTVTSLNWSIVGGTVGGNGTNTSTAGPTPSVNASFSITGTGGLGAGYKLRLEYTDADGSHVAFLPRLLDAKCNLKMSGGIKVTASAGGSELGSGNVAISWPDVFGDDCLPDPGGISVTADTDFNANLKLFDPFPTVTGTNDHLKALPADQKQLLTDTTKNFNLVGNLLNATLTNKTTGASCVITIIAMTINPNDTLSCFPLSLSGGARQTWLVGDEYEVTGNPLALLSQIIDQLDAIVDALGGAGVPVDQELPLLGISTEDLVAKIQNLKVTLDELRGFPTGTITCGTQENGLNPPSGDITGVPDGTSIYCRAVTQKAPDSFAWKITKGGAIAGGDVASQPNTVDLTPTDNIEFVIDDGDGDPTTTISEYQIVLEHTDSAGTHTTDFPALAPPNSLQKLEEAIELKLGIDPAALQLLLLDIGPQKATGTHDGAGGDGTLTDGGAAFIADGVVVGNTVTNVTDGSSCRIVAPLMAGSAPCSLAGGEENDWDNGDKYTIYGDETVDLVIRLGYGFCTTGNVTAVACEPSDRLVTKPTAPLNIDLDAFGGLVSLDSTTTTFQLEYAARAQLDFAMAIKFAFPPEFKILDTSKIEAKLGVAADNVNLTATIAGLELDLGAAVVIKADGGDHEGADSADTLTDTDATFVTTYPPAAGATFVQAGNVLTNTTKSKKCIVKTIAATALTCADPLPDSAVFADTDTYKITGAGVAKLGAELMVNQPGTDSGDEDNDGFTIGDFFTGLSADLQGTTQDCGGKIDPYPTGGGDEVDLMGHACARLSVSSDLTDYIGDVTFLAPDFATPAGWKFGAPDLEAVLGSFELDWALILKAMPKLLENLANSLNGAASDRSIPLVGDALDAGADVVLKIKENVADPLADLATQIDTAGDVEPSGGGDGDTDPLDLEKAAQDFIFGVFGPGGSAGIDLLQDTDGSGGAPDAADVVITVLCDHSGTVEPCVNGDDLFIIDDFRLTALIGEGSPSGQGCSPCELGTSIPISLGLPGFPLSIDGTIQANVGWRVLIDFGLSRADGPYLATGAHDVAGTLTAGEKELLLGASLSLGDNAPACALDPNPNTGVVDELKEFDSDRCVKGTLGFLAVTIRDGNDGTDPEKEPTSVAVEASLDLGSDGADPDRLTFPELLSGKANLDFNFGVTANVDVRIRTGLNLSSEHAPDFPSVLGRFHLEWSWALGTGSSDPDLSFDGLYIDAGRFLTDLLGPTAEEIKRVLSPFKPFIDFIQTPLPVISDISQLAGGPPITLIDVIEAASGQDLSMVRSVLEVVQFVQNLPTASNGLLIPLSSSITDGFSIAGDKAKGSPVTPDKAGTLVTPSGTPSTGLLAAIGGATGSSPSASTTPDGRPKTFGVSGLSFPFLNDASQIFTVLMGQDVTLVRYEAGPLRANAGFEYCAPPFIVVVVPVEICFGGSIELQGRFAMGYDTRGLRQLVGGGGNAADLLDGIFLDDLDANGNDVPEFTVIGRVYASGAATLFIVKVGVRAGLEATVDFNLDDSPNADGKLYIEEIVNKLQNPICLFVISGHLDVFLEAFVEIDLFLFTKEFTIEIIRLTLLEFSSACSPPTPNPADPSGADVIINIGPRKALRNINTEETEEEVVIRQLTIAACGAATRVSISMFGAYEEQNVGAGGRIIADGGVGDDKILLLSGATQDDQEIPFNVPAVINGGPGNDEIKTGNCNDVVTGDAGAEAGDAGGDKIDTSAGCDDADGNGAADSINLGTGNDNTTGAGSCTNGGGKGGTGEDVINGGLGDDRMDGGADGDVLNGGPGIDKSGTAESGGQCGNGTDDDSDDVADDGCPDGTDTLIGSAGHDALTGGTGDDDLYGDEVLNCDATGAAPAGDDQRRDSLDGGDGADDMWGGNGDDHMVGGLASDTMCGNGGDDFMDGDDDVASTPDSDDELHGGPDDDTLYGRGGHDKLFGDSGSGNDLLYGGPGPDDLVGGDGRDVLRGEGDNDILLGDTGAIAAHTAAAHAGSMASVVALVTPGNAAAVGSVTEAQCNADDVGAGAGNADCLFGADGNDYLFGEGGNDKEFGDVGTDYMEGNAGSDLMRGGQQDDVMHGNADSDEMHGDSGEDQMFGEQNVDTMRGGIGEDRMVGGSSTAGTADDGDNMKGDAGVDRMAGDNAQLVLAGSELEIKLLDLYSPGDAVNASVSGDDTMEGNAQEDVMYGGGDNDTMNGNEADDYMEGNAGRDTMHGDDGNDDMAGGSGHDFGGPSNAFRELPNIIDENTGGAGTGDVMHGDGGVDFMTGDNASITRSSPRLIRLLDVPFLNATLPSTLVSGDDTMNGNEGNDVMYGQGDHDTMNGGNGDDYMEGNAGRDTMHGDANEDDMAGGSGHDNGGTNGAFREFPNVLDDNVGGAGTGDVMHGDGGVDLMAGDNASITRASPRLIRLLDVPFLNVTLPGAAASGDDNMNGNDGNDIMYGQGDNDAMRGNAGDDYMEGNSGSDTMNGDEDDDDMLGGSGHDDGGPSGAFRELRNVLDDNVAGVGDTMHGDDDFDYMAGDNANITRPGGTHSYNGSAKRDVELYDVEVAGGPAISGQASGDDTMTGNALDDVMFGQGGDDTMNGNDDEDYMEGNHGSDTMAGDAGQDDMAGGGSANDGVITAGGDFDPARDADGLLDEGDTMYGESDTSDGATDGNGADAMMGDNGVITRPLSGGLWEINSFNGQDTRIITIADIETTANAPLPASISGPDDMWGNSNDDLMYGQGDMDEMHGNAGYDYMEGNAGGDTMTGDTDQDDMLGGTGPTTNSSQLAPVDLGDAATAVDGRLDGDDYMYGGAGTGETSAGDAADVMLGDNGTINRPLAGGGLWKTNSFNGQYNRIVHILDVETTANAPLSPNVSGDDHMWGNSNDDIMYGQGDMDEMHGGQGNDYMEGNAASDTMFGESNEDDMLGGTGPTTSSSQLGPVSAGDKATAVAGRTDISTAWRQVPVGSGNVYVPLGDTMYGAGAADNMIGDNGVIERPLAGPAWITHLYILQKNSIGDVADRHVTSVAAVSAPEAGANCDDGLDNDGDGVMEDGCPAVASQRYDRNTIMVDATTGKTAGSDLMYGDDGEDEMYGQFDDTRVPLACAGLACESTTQCENSVDDDADGVANDGCSFSTPVGPRETGANCNNTADNDGDSVVNDGCPTIGDEMHGGRGEDAMAGDQGNFSDFTLPGGGKTEEKFAPNEPFIDDNRYVNGTLFREFRFYHEGDLLTSPQRQAQITTGGYDRMRGDEGGDWMHGGAGGDLMNGDQGNDRLFGDNGDDTMWGGRHHDHLWGGRNHDHLDVHPVVYEPDAATCVKPPSGLISTPDPSELYTFGFADGDTTCDGNLEHVDYIYGGWDQDTLQANVGDNGPRIGDRLIDWVGVYNLYILCPATYGEFVITREFSPAFTDFLHRLAEGDGAFKPGPNSGPGSVPTDPSGFNEIAFVYKPDLKSNQAPPHVDTPAHFTVSADCGTIP